VTPETTCRFEELDGGALAVGLRPELNEVPWTDIERIGSGIVSRVATRERPHVLVDLSDLSHMGSAMVALVVRIWKAVTEKGGRMVVVNRNDLVGEVLTISGLAGKWTIVPTRDEALASFGTSPRGRAAANSGAGVALTVVAGLLLLLAVLALADVAFTGYAANAVGRDATLWIGLGCAAAAVLVGALAITRTDGALKMLAVSLTTLAAVAALAAVLTVSGALQGLARGPATAVRSAD
jgi:anti-anti-sigma factor